MSEIKPLGGPDWEKKRDNLIDLASMVLIGDPERIVCGCCNSLVLKFTSDDPKELNIAISPYIDDDGEWTYLYKNVNADHVPIIGAEFIELQESFTAFTKLIIWAVECHITGNGAEVEAFAKEGGVESSFGIPNHIVN